MKKIDIDGDVFYTVDVKREVALDALRWCKQQFGPHKSNWHMIFYGAFAFDRDTDYTLFCLRWA
jgi:hypothetical protein